MFSPHWMVNHSGESLFISPSATNEGALEEGNGFSMQDAEARAVALSETRRTSKMAAELLGLMEVRRKQRQRRDGGERAPLHDERVLSQLYDLLDVDKSGWLGVDEVQIALGALGVRMSKEELLYEFGLLVETGGEREERISRDGFLRFFVASSGKAVSRFFRVEHAGQLCFAPVVAYEDYALEMHTGEAGLVASCRVMGCVPIIKRTEEEGLTIFAFFLTGARRFRTSRIWKLW